jgi:hypothetical protein
MKWPELLDSVQQLEMITQRLVTLIRPVVSWERTYLAKELAARAKVKGSHGDAGMLLLFWGRKEFEEGVVGCGTSLCLCFP